MHSNRMRGKEHKLEQEKFQTNIRKNFFYPTSCQILESTTQRGCEISILRDVEDSTGQISELNRPALGSGVD